MELPKTEVELRIAATEIMQAFVEGVHKQLDMEIPDTLPFFDMRAVKAACVWAARSAIRRYCPHLAEEGERNMAGLFDPSNDKPI